MCWWLRAKIQVENARQPIVFNLNLANDILPKIFWRHRDAKKYPQRAQEALADATRTHVQRS